MAFEDKKNPKDNLNNDLHAYEVECETAFVKLAMKSYIKNKNKELLKETEQYIDDPEYKISDKAIRSFYHNLNALKRKKHFKQIALIGIKYAKRVAVFILLFSVILGTTMIMSEGFRRNVFNMFLGMHEEYTEVNFNNKPSTDKMKYITLDDAYLPTYITAGYTISIVKDMPTTKYFKFENEEKNTFSFYQYDISANALLDTENADFIDEPLINSLYKGFLVVKNGYSNLIWSDSKYVFELTGKIDYKELLKMADSVVKIDK